MLVLPGPKATFRSGDCDNSFAFVLCYDHKKANIIFCIFKSEQQPKHSIGRI